MQIETLEASKSGGLLEPLISRLRLSLISKMGFNQLKNPIMLIGLVLPRLTNAHRAQNIVAFIDMGCFDE